MADEPNFITHAFKSQYNLIGLGTALGFSLISGTPLPLLLAAAIDLIVLPIVAGNERFQRLVRARALETERQDREERKGREAQELLRSLPEPERQRYLGLETLAGEIRQNYGSLDASSQALLDELVQKLDFLMSFYLRMRQSLARYGAYFSTTDPERIQERIAMLEHEMATGNERIKEIKARTRTVLRKRLDRYTKALENRQLIEAQTETVLEVLQLLRDQSYSMRDPREITQQLDGLVSSAEETERGVRDMEDLLAADRDLVASGGLEAADLALLDPLAEPSNPAPHVAAPQAQRPRVVVSPAAAPPPPPPPARKRQIQ